MAGYVVGAVSYEIQNHTMWWDSKESFSGALEAGVHGAASAVGTTVAVAALVAGDPAPAEQAGNDLEPVIADAESIAAESEQAIQGDITAVEGDVSDWVKEAESGGYLNPDPAEKDPESSPFSGVFEKNGVKTSDHFYQAIEGKGVTEDQAWEVYQNGDKYIDAKGQTIYYDGKSSTYVAVDPDGNVVTVENEQTHPSSNWTRILQ